MPLPGSRAVAAVWVPLSAAACAYLVLKLRRLTEQIATERRLRYEERRGRTRAEISLRNLKKRGLNCAALGDEDAGAGAVESGCTVVRPLGRVRTPFVKRAGTPRQGALCPSSRGVLTLEARGNVCAAALEGLEQYSHVWILFDFHANTDDPTKRKSSKVAPPRGYGEKVGWIATRSPHRANSLGLSLVRLEGVDRDALVIRLSGIDLCDGTPVYDVKPCVPWDVPGWSSHSDAACSAAEVARRGETGLRVPVWVSQADELERVDWTERAEASLAANLGALALFGYKGTGALEAARAAISELLKQDPRNKRCRAAANHERVADTTTTTTTTTTESYRILFGGLELEFAVVAQVARVLEIRPAPPEDDRLRLNAD